jgi:hypothetical protein
MSLRCLTLLIILALFGFGRSVAQAEDSACLKDGRDGTCWNSLGLGEKVAFVQGIWAGTDSRTIGYNLTGSALSRFPRDLLDVPSGTTIGDIIDYFDALYRTPANRGIKWHWAYILAAMNARDDNSDDRLSLIKFLRQHESVPTSGEIVGVKAPEVVTIKSEQGTFDVHLEGVTSEGLSEAQRQTVTAFLLSVARADSISIAIPADREVCGNPGNLSVRLVYRSQFFRNGETLSAILTVQPFLWWICLKDRAVRVSNLDPGGAATFYEELYLNDLLLSSGLALPEPGDDADPNWAMFSYEADTANEQGLYIYGAGRIPLIDDIIAHGVELASRHQGSN